LQYFGASSVDVIDISLYEKTDGIGSVRKWIVQDMNYAMEENIKSQYDTVIDAGTLQHIFNVPQAINNLVDLLRPTGQILHMLPSDNFNNYGFYQFSPDLFFARYSSSTGFKDTDVFLSYLDDKYIYKVLPKSERPNKSSNPSNICRTNKRTNVMVRSVLKSGEVERYIGLKSNYNYEKEFLKPTPQKTGVLGGVIVVVRRTLPPVLYKFILRLYKELPKRLLPKGELNKNNPNLIRLKGDVFFLNQTVNENV